MANDLRLQVILSAVDKATRPLKKLRDSARDTGEAMLDTNRELKALKDQQKDLTAFRKTRTALNKTQRELRDYRNSTGQTTDKVKRLSERYKQQENA